MECTEVVVFEVEERNFVAFCAAREQLIAETRAQVPGLLATTLLRHITNPEICSDLWVWTNSASAQAGYAAFASLPSATEIMRLVKRKIYSGHFEAVDGQPDR